MAVTGPPVDPDLAFPLALFCSLRRKDHNSLQSGLSGNPGMQRAVLPCTGESWLISLAPLTQGADLQTIHPFLL